MLPSLCLALALAPAADASSLAVIRTAPDFRLVTQDEKPLRLADLRGKVVLVSFIFTTCSGSCPATTSRMVQVQQALKAKNHDAERVHLISITLDPARDTPEKLRQYMKLYDIDAANWSFLTGSPEEVNQVVAAWGMWAKPAANGQLDRSNLPAIASGMNRVREA